MSEDQEQPTTSEPVASTTEDESRYNFDESLLVRNKNGNPIEPQRPDQAEADLQIKKLKDEISKYSNRIKDIKALIDARRDGARGISSEARAIIQRLTTMRDEMGALRKQRAAIRDERVQCDAKRDALRAQLRSIRDKFQPFRVRADELEQRIAETEYKLTHESLQSAQEKQLHSDLTQLNSLRPDAAVYRQLEARLKETEGERAGIQQRLSECDGLLDEYNARYDADQALVDEIKARESQEVVDVPTLNVEKQEAWEIIQAFRNKIDEIQKDKDAKYANYIKLDRNYRAWKRYQSHLKYLEREKARQTRDEDRKTQTAEYLAPAQPFEAEVYKCEQMLTYLRTFLPKEEVSKEESKQVEAPSGMKTFKRKEDDLDAYTGLAKKKGAKKGAEPKTPEKPAAKRLNHTLDTLKTFMELSVEVPVTTADIAATVEKVESRKAAYLEKRQAVLDGKLELSNGHTAGPKGVDLTEPEESAAPEQPAAASSETADVSTVEKAVEESADSSGEQQQEAALNEEPAAAAEQEAAKEAAVTEEEAKESETEEEEAAAGPEAEADEPVVVEAPGAEEDETPETSTLPAGKGDGSLSLKLTVEDDKVAVSIHA